MVMVENICAVEPLDYGALGKSNMAQIIHKTPDDGTGIIYFQAKVGTLHCTAKQYVTLCCAALPYTVLQDYTMLHFIIKHYVT